jgi:formylmethanofuran dehydrogenase subunit B
MDGDDADLKDAIDAAADILRRAKNPMVFGLDHSTMEAQREGIELAMKIEATLDDASGQGEIVERIFSGSIDTCTLDDVRDNADVIVYWGSDPSNSHPRHLSRFSYFPRGKLRQKGMEDRTAICIDVRESSTAEICQSYKIPPGRDEELMREIIDLLNGKIPKSVLETKQLIQLTNSLKKAKYGILFIGSGLKNFDALEVLLHKLGEITEFYSIPMVEHNTIGFNRTLYDKTGYVNEVSFKDCLEKSPVREVLRNKIPDAALIIGEDALSSIPFCISKYLLEIPTITIDSFSTPTTEISKVVIPSAINGIEAEGSVLRMDGLEFKLEKTIENDRMSEEDILKALSQLL